MEHPILEGRCCPQTEEILKRAIAIGASDEELRKFREFFNMHPYTDLARYNQFRERGDGSFEKLLTMAFEDAEQFKGKAKGLLFDCFLEDLSRKKRDFETLYGILAEKIKAHIEGKENAQVGAEFFHRTEAMQKLNEVVKNTDTDLPPLNEVIKDAAAFLPKLWEALAGMPAPLVSRSGAFIWSGENVSVLMALAQALKTAEKVLGDYSTEQVYRILCRHFNTPEAKRPRIKARTATGYTNAYFDYLSDLNDTLEGL